MKLQYILFCKRHFWFLLLIYYNNDNDEVFVKTNKNNMEKNKMLVTAGKLC